MAVLRNIRTKVVGVTKKNDCDERIQDLLENLVDGSPLELEHETDNEYDENAVKVYCDCDHIGYLSREIAEEIVDDVDAGMVEAEISEITGGYDGKSYGCNIVIRILDIPAAPVQYQPRPKPDLPQDLIESARAYIKTVQTVNISALQKQLGIGYTTAAALVDKLEELGDVGPFQGAQPRPIYVYEPNAVKKPLINRIFKPVVITCLIIIVLCWGAVFAITSQREKAAKAAAEWDRLAISTATVALDQYAPGVNYGPLQTTGWLVLHNSDGTTTVWAPREYGNIYLMMTDDGESYTPYCISVNNTKVLDVGKP